MYDAPLSSKHSVGISSIKIFKLMRVSLKTKKMINLAKDNRQPFSIYLCFRLKVKVEAEIRSIIVKVKALHRYNYSFPLESLLETNCCQSLLN